MNVLSQHGNGPGALSWAQPVGEADDSEHRGAVASKDARDLNTGRKVAVEGDGFSHGPAMVPGVGPFARTVKERPILFQGLLQARHRAFALLERLRQEIPHVRRFAPERFSGIRMAVTDCGPAEIRPAVLEDFHLAWNVHQHDSQCSGRQLQRIDAREPLSAVAQIFQTVLRRRERKPVELFPNVVHHIERLREQFLDRFETDSRFMGTAFRFNAAAGRDLRVCHLKSGPEPDDGADCLDPSSQLVVSLCPCQHLVYVRGESQNSGESEQADQKAAGNFQTELLTVDRQFCRTEP